MQTVSFDMDAATWDNTISVRYESARAVPSIVDLPPRFDGKTPAPATPASRNKPLYVEVAKRRNLTVRELAASGGAYTSLDQIWLIPDALFPVGLLSKPGDVVVELDGDQQGARWTVLEAGRGKNRQTRRLTCRDLVLSLDLADAITIERPAISYDAAGAPVKAFPSDAINPGGVVLYAALVCRVQLVEKKSEEERGTRGLGGAYEITVSQELDVTQEDRVLLANGLYLDIVGYRNAQRIDLLPTLLCERKV